MGVVPLPTAEGLRKLRRTARQIRKRMPIVNPWTLDRMADHYTGLKKARYVKAIARVRAGGVDRKDARVTMFVKFEKIKFSQKKVNPTPRAIQFRRPKYCVALAQYLKPCEEFIYRLKGDGKLLPPTRIIGKGLSQDARAALCVKKWKSMVRPVCITLDASRFDKHVSEPLLEIEHSIYTAMCPYPHFQKLLSWQLRNRGKTGWGITYKTVGRRMSGDMNTALGNCILMIIMVATAFRGFKYECLDDGDDVLVFLEAEDLERALDGLKEEFLSYGFVIKLENVAHQLHEIEWCQSRLVEIAPEVWKFVRNPSKVMSSALGGVKYMQQNSRPKLLNTIGYCETILNKGVPVLQAFAMSLIRNSDTEKVLELQATNPLYYRMGREMATMGIKSIKEIEPDPITDTARLSFFKAFGITYREQLQLEEFFNNWSFSTQGECLVPPEIDTDTWSLSHYWTREAQLLA